MYGFSLMFCHVLYQMYGFYPPSNVPNVRILPCPIPETYFSLWTPAVQRAPCTDAVGDAEASGEGKIFFFRSIRLLIRHAITKIQQKYKYSDFILLRSKKPSKLVTLLTKSSLEQKDSCYINCLTFFLISLENRVLHIPAPWIPIRHTVCSHASKEVFIHIL